MVIVMSMVIRAGSKDDPLIDKMLNGIGYVESGNNDYPNGKALHRDGKSYGRYGVTKMALKEMQRLDRVPQHWTEKDLQNRLVNYSVAYEYLLYQYEKCKSWYKAVGWYHGGDDKRRDEYANKVFKHL